MNPQPTLFPVPFGEQRHGCDGDGCASDPNTWPLHQVIHRGQHCRLCCSCILLSLSHRSLYCCHCFFLVTKSWSDYDDGDTLMAPPAPIYTCVYCCQAVAHLPCLYQEQVPVVNGGFVCPPCTAALNGRRFTYGPPCRQPLDQRDARVLLLAARIALAQLNRHATTARAAAERMAREAREARKRADEALSVAYDLAKEDPSWVPPQSPENDLAASEEEGIEAEASVGEVLLVRRNAMPMPSLATLAIGAGSSVVPMALAEAKHTPTSSQPKLPFDLNKNADENGLDENILNESAAANKAGAVQAETALNSFSLNNVPLNSPNVKEVAMAAAEAARASLPTPQALHLFPSAKASSSTKMPCTKKPRTKRLRTLQLFKHGEKKM